MASTTPVFKISAKERKQAQGSSAQAEGAHNQGHAGLTQQLSGAAMEAKIELGSVNAELVLTCIKDAATCEKIELGIGLNRRQHAGGDQKGAQEPPLRLLTGGARRQGAQHC